jgi:hypothetical protein
MHDKSSLFALFQPPTIIFSNRQTLSLTHDLSLTHSYAHKHTQKLNSKSLHTLSHTHKHTERHARECNIEINAFKMH